MEIFTLTVNVNSQIDNACLIDGNLKYVQEIKESFETELKKGLYQIISPGRDNITIELSKDVTVNI